MNSEKAKIKALATHRMIQGIISRMSFWPSQFDKCSLTNFRIYQSIKLFILDGTRTLQETIFSRGNFVTKHRTELSCNHLKYDHCEAWIKIATIRRRIAVVIHSVAEITTKWWASLESDSPSITCEARILAIWVAKFSETKRKSGEHETWSN